MFHNESPNTLGATVQNSAARNLCFHVVNTVWKLVTKSGRGIFLDAVISFHGKTEINKNQIQGVDYKLHQTDWSICHCTIALCKRNTHNRPIWISEMIGKGMTDLSLITDGTEDFFLQRLLQIDSEAIQVLIQQVKRSKREAIHSLPWSSEFKNAWHYPPCSHMLHLQQCS